MHFHLMNFENIQIFNPYFHSYLSSITRIIPQLLIRSDG